MSCWWPFGKAFARDDTVYHKSDYAAYKDYTTTYDVPNPIRWELTTTTVAREKPFYHPASYSKRWKRK